MKTPDLGIKGPCYNALMAEYPAQPENTWHLEQWYPLVNCWAGAERQYLKGIRGNFLASIALAKRNPKSFQVVFRDSLVSCERGEFVINHAETVPDAPRAIISSSVRLPQGGPFLIASARLSSVKNSKQKRVKATKPFQVTNVAGLWPAGNCYIAP